MVAMRKSAGNDEKKDAKKKVGCEKKIAKKGAWSKQEDQKLIEYIQKHGEGCWSSLPQSAGMFRLRLSRCESESSAMIFDLIIYIPGLLRCGKSCRLRWVNYLKPDVKRGNFGEDEEDLIVKLHALLGNRLGILLYRKIAIHKLIDSSEYQGI